jgi:sodium/proline symporter
MTAALVIVVVFGVTHAGGVSAVGDSLSGLEANFKLTGSTGQFGVISIISTLAWGLGYFGMPHILLRFMAIEEEGKLKLSRRIASIWVVISMAVAVLIGVLGFSFVTKSGLVTSEGFDPERIVIYFADAISQVSLPAALVAGLIFAGILASIMSTADSQMLAAASSVSENIVHRFFWVNMSNKAQMLFARVTVLVITIVAVIFAWDPNSSVFRIVSFAWAGFGAAFGPLVLFSLFWKRTTKWGAFAGILSGGVMVFLWKYVIAGLHPVLNIYELLPAFLVSCLCIVVVSLLTPAPDKAVTDTFDAVKENR